MKKKFKLNNIIPHILAAVTVITIIIACGEGDIINVDNDLNVKRGLNTALGNLDGKLDTLTNAEYEAKYGSSSSDVISSSGVVSGESSSGTEIGQSSSGTEIGESSSGAEIGESSSGGTTPSSSSEEYELKCAIHNPLETKDPEKFNIDDDENKIPTVTCVKVGAAPGENGGKLEYDDVEWTPAINWAVGDKIAGVYPGLSVKATDKVSQVNSVCIGKTAICGDLTICYKGSPSCQISSSSSAAEASSSSAEEVSSSSDTPDQSSSSAPAGSSNSCTQLTLKDGVYQTPKTDGITPAGACFSFSCTGNLQAGLVSGNSRNIKVPVCDNNEVYTIAATGSGNFNNPPAPASIPYTSICNTSGDVQVFLSGNTLSSTTQYMVFKCSPGCSVSGSYDIIDKCIDVSAPPMINCTNPTNLEFKVGSALANGIVPGNQSSTKLGSFCNAISSSSGKVWLTGGTCGGTAITAPIQCDGSIAITKPLTCDELPQQTGTVGNTIAKPIVKCGTTTLNSNLTWTNAPNWDSPAEKKYTNISVSASCDSKTRSASCAGEIEVLPAGATTYTAACSWTGGSGVKLHSGDSRPANPVITCTPSTGGATITGTVDASALPPAGNNLSTTSTKTYAPDQSVIKCNGEAPTNTVSCGTLTVYPKLACYGAAQTIIKGTTPDMLTATCGGTPLTTGITWTPNIAAAISIVQNATAITAKATCGDEQTVNCTTSSTSTTNTTITVTPSLTCAVAKSTVTQGENIGPPTTLTCSDNGTAGKSSASFTASSGTAPTGIDNWKSTGSAYYSGSSVTGSQTIQVSGVTCTVGTTVYNVPGNTSCGTITVNRPTCTASGASGNIEIGATITPTVSCGNATKSGNATFTCTGSNCSGWSASGGGGSFTSSGNKTLALSSVTCDNHSITGITGQNCPAVTVNAPTITCTIASPLTSGAAVTPTLTCSNGGAAPTGTITYTSAQGANTPIDGSGKAASVLSSTTYTGVTVSGTCGSVAATGYCNNVTVNPAPVSVTYSLSCSSVSPTTVTAGTQVTKPAVVCNGSDGSTSSPSSLTYLPSTLDWNNPSTTNSPYVITVTTSAGNCSGSAAASCGTLTVTPDDEATYCSGASKIITLPCSGNQCNEAGTLGTVCYKRTGTLNGWTASNSAGRSCSINGGASTAVVDNTSQNVTISAINGFVYFNCTAGTYNYFSITAWGP